jgi:DNA-binding HxlR family transcriptional regulator
MSKREAAKFLNKNYRQWQEKSLNIETCPARNVLSHIGNKWTTLLLIAISEQPQRFNELRRNIPIISQRVLTQTLRNLEVDGLVKRTVYPTKPPSVEYSLTPLGESLLVPISELYKWADANYNKILASRKKYKRAEKNNFF